MATGKHVRVVAVSWFVPLQNITSGIINGGYVARVSDVENKSPNINNPKGLVLPGTTTDDLNGRRKKTDTKRHPPRKKTIHNPNHQGAHHCLNGQVLLLQLLRRRVWIHGQGRCHRALQLGPFRRGITASFRTRVEAMRMYTDAVGLYIYI